MDEQHTAAQPQADTGLEDEVSLLDLLIVLAKHKWLILGLPLLTGIAA